MNYLYDANVAVRKANLYNTLCKKYHLYKISANSHLFTSKRPVEKFPGKSFEIVRVFGKKEFYRNKPVDRAVVATRNFPDSVDLIRRKSGIKEGMEVYVYATRNNSGKSLFIVAKKLH
jgi:hypothetical protein